MPVERTIDCLELPAADLDAVTSFHEHACDRSFTDYCAFTDGRTDGGFFGSHPRCATETGAALNVLYASDLEQTLQTTIEACGGSLVRDIFVFPGDRRFHIADPDGNEPAAWSDSDGRR